MVDPAYAALTAYRCRHCDSTNTMSTETSGGRTHYVLMSTHEKGCPELDGVDEDDD